MAKKRRVLLAAALVFGLAATCLLAIGLEPHEPIYRGKSLTFWLEQYQSAIDNKQQSNRKEAEEAIRHIGTKAIPSLLRLITSRHSVVILKLLAPLPNEGVAWFHLPGVFDYGSKVHARQMLGVAGFEALEQEANSAIPALIALINDKEGNVRIASISALGFLGPAAKDALPSLIASLNDPGTGQEAVIALGKIHQEPELIIPILTNILQTSRSDLRVETMRSLAAFGGQAKAAVPILFQLLNDQDTGVSFGAGWVLRQIDPEAAAKAGVKLPPL